MGDLPCYAGLVDEAGRIPDPPDVRIQRVYDLAGENGPSEILPSTNRVLVDRVWPRGISKERLGNVTWERDVAPSTELRKWFGHEPERWPEFRRRYRDELAAPERQEALRRLADLARPGPLVLLYGAKDDEHNQAVVLRDVLLEYLKGEDADGPMAGQGSPREP